MTNEQKYKTTESEEEPKPCPFCGGTTEVNADGKWYAKEGYEMFGADVSPYNINQIEFVK